MHPPAVAALCSTGRTGCAAFGSGGGAGERARLAGFGNKEVALRACVAVLQTLHRTPSPAPPPVVVPRGQAMTHKSKTSRTLAARKVTPED